MYRPLITAATSAPFSISPSVYFRAALVARRWVAPASASTVILISFIVRAMATGDIRPAIIALILLFIAMPMAMAMVYFTIAFSPAAARSTLPHTVEFRDDGSLLIRYVAPPDTGDTPVRHKLPADDSVEADDIKKLRRTSRHLIFTLKNGVLVIVPLQAVKLPDAKACSVRDFD